MDVMAIARELGEAIAASSEMKKYRDSEAEFNNDYKAGAMMNDYKQLQIELVKATKENKDKTVIDSIKQRLMSKQQELNEYDITYNYLVAKSDFDKFMKTVNDVIIFSITGEEPCSPDKCGSCGGGCK
jgi:cell fate (sporulation/competence/biofilm development) regulator YlbF (YheA/YmcA/DUF963 family)